MSQININPKIRIIDFIHDGQCLRRSSHHNPGARLKRFRFNADFCLIFISMQVIQNLMNRIYIAIIKRYIIGLHRKIISISCRPEHTNRHIEPCTHIKRPFYPINSCLPNFGIRIPQRTEFELLLGPGMTAQLHHLQIIVVE